MISHEHRLIFIHIPKCAGTSVERYFGHFEGMDGERERDHRTIRDLEAPVPAASLLGGRENLYFIARRLRRRYVRPARFEVNNIMPTPRQFRDYYKFTILRNPWDRMMSWYRDVQRHKPHQRIYPSTDLTDFVKRYAGWKMLGTYEFWTRTFNGRDPMNRVILMENMKKGLEDLAADLGLGSLTLPRENAAESPAERSGVTFSDEADQIIRHVYSSEIDRFGYDRPQHC